MLVGIIMLNHCCVLHRPYIGGIAVNGLCRGITGICVVGGDDVLSSSLSAED